MIPTIITLLIRKYSKRHPEQFAIILGHLRFAGKIFLLLGAAICIALSVSAQEENYSYVVKRNGDDIGTLTVKQVTVGNIRTLKMESDIKTRFIFSFRGEGKEEAVYQNGILVYSHVYQKLNGTEKVNKKTTYANKKYLVSHKDGQEFLDSPVINYNLICIYTIEPVHFNRIYSDKFQKFLPILKTGPNRYKIVFPDKNYNEYFYDKGICKKIEVNNTLYSAVMELR